MPSAPPGPAPLLERERELATLGGLAWRTATGGGSAAAVVGHAGSGKTRLLEAFAREAAANGMRVLSARGSGLERDVPFGVARQLFEHLAVDGGQRVGTVVNALHRLLANAAVDRRLLVIVDDAHWADEPTLRWLEHLDARLAEVNVLVVVAARPAEPGAVAFSPDELTARGLAVLEPRPLSREAVAGLARLRLGGAADPELVDGCLAASGGNAFLVSELLAELARGSGSGDLAARVGESRLEGVSRSVLARVRHAGPGALALTRAVVVLAERAEPGLAAELAELSPEAAAGTAEVLAGAHILRLEPALGFVHPAVRATVYEDIPPGERSRLHARAARLLLDRGASAEQAASHLLAAEPAGDRWAVQVLESAAARAAAAGDGGTAARYLRRALADPAAAERRFELVLALGNAENVACLPGATDHLADALASAERPEQRGRAALELGRALIFAEQDVAALDALQAGIDAVEGRDRELALRLHAEAIAAAQSSSEARRLLGHAWERLVPEVEGAATPAERLVLGSVAWERALSASVPAPEVAALAERALAGSQPIASETSDSPAYYGAIGALVHAGRDDLAERHLDAAIEDATRRRSALGFAVAMCWRAWLHHRRGDLRSCESDARASLEAAAEHGFEVGLPIALALAIECLLERAEPEEAAAELDRLPPDFERRTAVFYDSLRVSRARVRVAFGERAGALDDLLRCGQRLEECGVRNPGMAPWRSAAAHLLAAAGDATRARELAEEELDIARGCGVPRTLGMALRAAGTLHPDGARLALLEEAESVLAASGARLEHARALCSLGGALLHAGRALEARDPLRAAMGAAHDCGSVVLRERARAALVAAGGRPRRPAVTGLDALTPTERRVTAMAASGMTNRDVAAACFVSLRAIEKHLSRAYAKLGIDGRSQLADALDREVAETPER